jgi:hypothetical protein
MNSFLPKTFTKFLFFVMLFVGQLAVGQLTLPTTSPYSQNFNTTPGAAGTTYPTGWISYNGTTADATMGAGTATSATAANYNYGSRIGLLGSGTNFDPGSIVLEITNTTGKSALQISYDVIKIREQTRSLSFDLEVSTTSATAGFIPVTGGAYVSGTLPNNDVATYTNLNISDLDNSASTVWIRWRYANISGTGSRDGIALDNVSLSWSSGSSAPTVTTTIATSITTSSASSGGDVTADGGAAVTARGVAFSTTANPTTGTSDGTGTGIFSSSLTSLSLNTQYFYRAYATNSVGTAYGAENDFYTLAATPGVVVVNNPQFTTLDVTVNATTENSNPSVTQYAIQETGGQYVQTNGSLGATAVWQTAANWATVTVTGLTASTTYTFQATARNAANIETAFGGTASGTTSTPETMDFSVVQFPNSTQTITEGTGFIVFSRAFENGITTLSGASSRVNAWIGYSETNDNPANTGWTWIAATFNEQVGNDDEYQADIPTTLAPGTYYYAARFEIDNSGVYTYGGTGGNWNSDNVTLTVNADVVDFANIQFPATATITEGATVTVFAQVFEPGITPGGGAGLGITAEIGYSASNTTPDGTWTWLPATYNTDAGNNDEYQADLGTSLTAGTYYYASRFIKDNRTVYIYGGTGGNWNNDSGILTVNALGTPVATAATVVGVTAFTANWDAVTDATSYEIDVYEENTIVATDLFISEYVEGSSNNKYIEIYNGTGASVDLADYELRAYSNGSTTPTTSTVLSGTLANGETIVYSNSAAAVYAGATTNASSVNFNGDDAMALYKISTTSFVDVFGRIGDDPGTQWTGTGGYSTLNKTLVRQSSVTGGITVSPTGTGDSAFTTLTTEWDLFDIDTVTDLGSHTFTGGTNTTYFLQNQNVGAVTSYEVTGLNPETTYYYVVRAILGANISASSNEITVTTKPTSVTWDGTAWSNTTGPDAVIEAVLTGAYATSTEGGFTAKKLTVATGGSLTIAASTSVTVVNELINDLTATAVVIESDGSLIQNGTSNTNTGDITVKRNTQDLMRLDYTLWSSPVDAQNLGSFSPLTTATRFYTYTTATNIYTAIANSNDFTVGEGYLIRTPDTHPTSPTAWEGNFIGTPNSGDITFGLSTAGTGFNAVGNPYPSPINIATFLADNTSVIAGNLYFWRKTNAATGSAYVTFSGSTFSSGPQTNNTIQPGQGFIVGATAASNLSFNNLQRVADNGVFFRNANTTQSEDNSRIWLNLLANNEVVGQMAVGYRPDATNEIDALDANYINDSALALNSFVANTELAVQHRAAFEPTDVVALSFKANTAENYTIAINAVDGLFDMASQTIFLKDNVLNTEHDLRSAPYSFTTEVGTFTNRFEIVYQSTLSVSNPNFENGVVVYSKNKTIEINTRTETIATVRVIDIRGSLVSELKAVNTNTLSIPLTQVANQVLIIQITGTNGQTISKKVVH